MNIEGLNENEINKKIREFISDTEISSEEIIKFVKENCQTVTLKPMTLGLLFEMYVKMDYDSEDEFNGFSREITIAELKEIHPSFEPTNGNAWARGRGGYLGDKYKIERERVNGRSYSVRLIGLKSSSVEENQHNSSLKRNVIYFGAPGTGKSFSLETDKKKLLKNLKNNYERVTFHPDYSYANFVGVYKPVPDEDEDGNPIISYKYVPGPFMRLLVKALDKPEEPFILIIEEINRANVAAVFGDVFQLLDRKGNVSRYDIQLSEDMKNHMYEKLGKQYERIKIPENLYIWATMNSADQGVFPMDSAFKRRWEFKYLGINNQSKKVSKLKIYGISWNTIREAINEMLLSNKINEDKLLGPFFAFSNYVPEEDVEDDIDIDEDEFNEIFKNKILMYLFEDVAKPIRNDLFEGARGDNDYVTYSEICESYEDIKFRIFHSTVSDKIYSDDDGE